jgi:hypothetical protein
VGLRLNCRARAPNVRWPPLTRSKVDLFLYHQRRFGRDIKANLRQPPGFPFNLRSAVDRIL